MIFFIPKTKCYVANVKKTCSIVFLGHLAFIVIVNKIIAMRNYHIVMLSFRVYDIDCVSGHFFINNDGMAFSTRDKDNDKWSAGNCAVRLRSGWWYTGCGGRSLNNYGLMGARVDMRIRPQ